VAQISQNRASRVTVGKAPFIEFTWRPLTLRRSDGEGA
jgi:hypothetical protein